MAREGPLPWWHPGRLWFWMGVLAILGVGWWYSFLIYVNHEDPAFIDDPHFVAEANVVCVAAGDRVPAPAGEDATFEERASGVESLALIFDDLADDLATIEVVGVYREAVEDWIDDIRSFAGVGRDYATALRTGDPEVYRPAGDAGDDLNRRVNAFAEANGVDDCLALLRGG